MKRIGVLVSGGGSNLQAIIDAIKEDRLQAEIGVVISNKAGVYALERAEQNGIPTVVIDHKSFNSVVEFSQAILECLKRYQVDLVCLAGFLRILDRVVIDAYPNRILNIHPALLPAFGGKGMYGHHVHEAVIASGTKYTGATVHIVTPETDVGPIITQGIVGVADDDTPESIAAKVLKVEHQIYPEAIRLLLEDQVVIDGLRVIAKK
ncbi:MAG TPA: phosphoribosylglycinamide formyltransferase [Bacillota bacterium]|nr:phosphoribosylglycinamide formyltransferase [Bacillota bacterium]HOL09648.1 phosphoribosylglycinamide formyltransferase [Bacillota bacterium]HPO97501.1 phosphoribosylglycinamide formyltransferase [Bacillota bacterium]